MLLVKDLIALLQKGNPEAEVVRVGHFGEHFQFSQYDFTFQGHPTGYAYKLDDPQNCKFLEIAPPDIGEEPT